MQEDLLTGYSIEGMVTYLVVFFPFPSVPPSLFSVALDPGDDFFTAGLDGTSSSSSLCETIISFGDGNSLTSNAGGGVLGGAVILRVDSLGGVRVGDCFSEDGLLEICMANMVFKAADRCGREGLSLCMGGVGHNVCANT